MPPAPRTRSPRAANERLEPTRARGRPRSERARRKVLEATRALFEEGGYAAANIEAIAARSGVAKTTIYRWWHNRPTLVVELLLEVAAEAAPPPAGRDPMQAIRTELRLVTRAADALPGRLLLALLSEAQRDAQVRNALLRHLFDPRRQATARVVRRGQEAGQLRSGVPPLLAVDLLFGPLFYRRFIRQEHVPKGYVDEILRHVLRGLAPDPIRKRRKRATGAAPPRRRIARKGGRAKPAATRKSGPAPGPKRRARRAKSPRGR